MDPVLEVIGASDSYCRIWLFGSYLGFRFGGEVVSGVRFRGSGFRFEGIGACLAHGFKT